MSLCNTKTSVLYVCMYVYYDKRNDVHDKICGNTVTRLLVPSVMWSGHMDTYPALTDSHR